MTNAFVNGKYMAAEDACLNIEDRGTLFGDGVYEFFKVHNGKVFMAEEHLDRLRYSASELELTVPYSDEKIRAIIDKLIDTNALQYGGIYLQLTRGAAHRIHQFPDECSPNFFIVAREMPPVPQSLYEEGMSVLLLPDQRWKRCDIKSLNLLANILAKQKAIKAGVDDAILYSERGITESTSSSVFTVIDGVLTTTPPGPWILPGITRQAVLELALKDNIPVAERFVSKEELTAADEVIITNTRSDVTPVTTVDGKPVGNGKPGKITRRLMDLFADLLK
ncbi:D-amino-acid transaminase [Dethiobacter alkaliphilus]|uniref:D-amino-acid transaminase n=1 Tax=Dethiobacter alkaliphilus TaxID=427926 RepID=UPI00222630B2|nr:D-amino-acid transaminase [Dethiobacter alkaliphilus]MCW3489576.1 D-amino-acid transaminase [Dethiobacter alkaliphilus]